MAKLFTTKDLGDYDESKSYPHIFLDDWRKDLNYSPLWHHERGLMQTATGYGRKLNSGYKISFNGKLYRIYTTCFSNAGSSWFIAKGKKIFVS